MDVIQIITTTPTRELADEMASRLVERRLAACVQVDGPIGSTYRWQDKLEQDQEWRLTAKTLATCFDRAEAAIRELHPYDVPEILAIPVALGHRDYLDWIAREVAE